MVVAGHLATFLLAARTAGIDAPLSRLLPLALLALLAMGLPLNVAGWGPREGVAAWVFGAAGLSAAAASPPRRVYGVLVLVASLPGAPSWSRVAAPVAPTAARGGCRSSSGGSAVADRPYTLLSCGMSIDGYLDGATASGCCCPTTPTSTGSTRSAPAATRSWSAPRTVRSDNPRLLVRVPGAARRAGRRGLPPSPIKVTRHRRADLDAGAEFFAAGDAEKLVYCASAAVRRGPARLGRVATVVDGGRPVDVRTAQRGPAARGVERLMVEGGGTVHTQFLTADLVAPWCSARCRRRRCRCGFPRR